MQSEQPGPPTVPALAVTVTSIPQGSRLTVVGELDLDTAWILAEALDEGLRAGDVDVDLSGLTFMDSSGIRTLLSAHDTYSDRRRLTAVAVSSQAARLIDIVGASELLGLRAPD